MKFSIQREVFLQPLSQVVGVVERRQTLPVLANFLLVAREGRLSVTGTDMEVELISSVDANISQDGEITVPARKLATLTFSWLTPRSRVEKKTVELLNILEKNNIQTKGQPFLMRYNDPWTPPFLRRNEVVIEVI